VTCPVIGVAGDRMAVQVKGVGALAQAAPVTLGAAVTAWAVTLEAGAAS
jgi:hypothetical protein